MCASQTRPVFHYRRLLAALQFLEALTVFGWLPSAHAKVEGTVGGPTLVVQTGHSDRVSALAYSPNGRLLATASFDQTIKLWDLNTGLQLRTLTSRTPLRLNWISSIAFSPNGKFLAAGQGDRTVRLWSIPDGRLLRTWAKHGGIVNHVAFSSSGWWLASGADDGAAVLYDLETYQAVKRFQAEPTDSVTGLCFSPNGEHLACAYLHSGFILWDRDSGAQDMNVPYMKQQTEGWVSSLVFTPDGKHLLSGSWSGQITLRSAATFAGERDLGHYADPVSSLALSPNGHTLAAGFGDGSVRFINTETGGVVSKPRVHGTGLVSVAVNTDGTLFASGGLDRAARLWSGKHFDAIETFSSRVPASTSAAFARKGAVLATGNDDGTISLWDTGTGLLSHSFHGPTRINCCAFNETGTTLATGFADGWIRLWSIRTGRLLQSWKANNYWVTSVAYQPGGRYLATGGSDGTVKLWDGRTGRLIRDVGFGEQTWSLAFSPDGSKLAIGTVNDDSTAAIWDLRHQRKVPLDLVPNAYSVAFDRTGLIVATGDDEGKVTLWNADTGARIKQLVGHTGVVNALAFSPQENILVSGATDCTLRVWTYHNDRRPIVRRLHDDGIQCLAFQWDGRRVASASADGSTGIWRLPDFTPVARLIQFHGIDYATVLPTGYYASSFRATDGLGFAWGDATYFFDQFDIRNHRPDLVLQQFGRGRKDRQVQAYSQAYHKRLMRLNLNVPPGLSHLHLPTIVLQQASIPRSTQSRTLELKVSLADNLYPLDHVSVYDNGVPCFGPSGVALRSSRTKSIPLLSLPPISLSTGVNRIEVSATNARGDESLRRAVRVFRATPAPQQSLYLVAVGVSNYRQPGHTLDSAALDAESLARYFKEAHSRFARIVSLVLPDERALRSTILQKAGALFGKARVDDTVVLFLAGHGQLVGKTFYFCPSDVDFSRVDKTGLSYAQLYGLFDKTSARQKLLLIDACEAGEVETAPSEGGQPRPVLRSSGRPHHSRLVVPPGHISLSEGFLLMQDAFCDLRRGNGSIVLVACRGFQEAQELPGERHGAFTFALLRGLRSGHTRISALRRYVTEEVLRLEREDQVPTLRQDNPMVDFDLLGAPLGQN